MITLAGLGLAPILEGAARDLGYILSHTFSPYLFPAPFAASIASELSAASAASSKAKKATDSTGPISANAPSAQQYVLIGEIERLASLRTSGALSEAEFDVLKAEALARHRGS
jgi:hypothetical protein